jgi:putative transcriptional regulator
MSTRIKHHPDAATLMSFAAGSLSEPLAAVVSAHASMCSDCRSAIRDMETIGAALVLAGAAAEDDAPVRRPAVPTRAHTGAVPAGQAAPVGDKRLPLPIALAYGLSLDRIPWKRLGPGVWHHRLAVSAGVAGDLRLLKIASGRRMPEHGHGGAELTLVIDGTYSDQTGTYGRGDIQDVDEDVEHTPVADGITGCVCLIASEHPARFKGRIARLLQPWTGM